MSKNAHVPAATGCQRDADGRLIGLIFDSDPPMPEPEGNPWLVAVDGSDNALRAVAYAVRQANEMHACALHLVHVQSWLSKEAAEMELAQRAWSATSAARNLLAGERLPWRMHVVMGDAAERIMELATGIQCKGVIIGSRGFGVTESVLFGSVATTLMRMSGPPVAVIP